MLHVRDYTFLFSDGIAIYENIQERKCRLDARDRTFICSSIYMV